MLVKEKHLVKKKLMLTLASLRKLSWICCLRELVNECTSLTEARVKTKKGNEKIKRKEVIIRAWQDNG